jgi:proteasome lid subunit RPN8/RPN11
MKKTKFILPYNEKRRLHYHAFRAQQKDQSEVCGVVLVGLDRKIRLQFLPNLSASSRSFEVSIRDVNAAKRLVAEQGMRVIGLFHSHIVSEAIPGPYDLQEAPLSYNAAHLRYLRSPGSHVENKEDNRRQSSY